MEKTEYFFKSMAVRVVARAAKPHTTPNSTQAVTGLTLRMAVNKIGVYVPAIKK